ncbi:MAG: 30S ribosomal protein S6 [Alphaproteobacteria bacterium MarineAlpha5_Bin9]|nr:MAG: 30S ribosomal protein S6 [Alphaproteobacteria bacterium MarineAlpha5_Bin9]|tara:strand:- start:48490 stop:48819 length:330 start_codon:yes stop_codon:yes gene_type:complete
MNNFEATLLISPDSSTNIIQNVQDSFLKNIENHGGKIDGKEDWGLRNLAYKIKQFNKAFYLFYQISIEGEKIKDVKKNLTLNEKIIRHLIVKVKNHEELPTEIMKKNQE